jgi:GNAT superfamily N-acetyltransferase
LLKLLCLDQDVQLGLGFVNQTPSQLGHVLPLSEKQFTEYFPPPSSYMILNGRRVEALFSTRSGSQKATPMMNFGFATTSRSAVRNVVGNVEETAIAQEKVILRTRVFGYDTDRVRDLKAAGFQIGASLPETVSFKGRRHDYHLMWKDLSDRYSFQVKRSYAKPGLYPVVGVEKAQNPKLRVRGYRPEDRKALDRFAAHPMVIRGLGSGLFDGLYPWTLGTYQEHVNAGRVFPIACEDENTGEAVGLLDLFKHPQDVLQHTMLVGMYVKPEYQGLGVGTLLMESMKTLARRLHLANVWLSVFDGNTTAERLYTKSGFVGCGKVSGWLQEGYVTETYMTLKLD